jgi:hypothetical protein
VGAVDPAGALEGYEPSLLDMACLSGDVRWARVSRAGVLRTTSGTPIALVASEHADAWLVEGGLRPPCERRRGAVTMRRAW